MKLWNFNTNKHKRIKTLLIFASGDSSFFPLIWIPLFFFLFFSRFVFSLFFFTYFAPKSEERSKRIELNASKNIRFFYFYYSESLKIVFYFYSFLQLFFWSLNKIFLKVLYFLIKILLYFNIFIINTNNLKFENKK